MATKTTSPDKRYTHHKNLCSGYKGKEDIPTASVFS